MAIPTPAELGLPARFADWRGPQERAFIDAISAPQRVVVAALPTGIGKSLLGMGISRFLGERTVILTSTKGLMDQYVRDFAEAGLYDVRGMGNYPCKLIGGIGSCAQGPCLDGDSCHYRTGGCDYFDRVAGARHATAVITNYAWWFQHRNDEGGALGPRDLLIADEAHTLVEEVAGAVGVQFHGREVDLADDMATWGLPAWQEWARENWSRGVEALGSGALSRPERRTLRDLVDRFRRLMTAVDWAWDFTPPKGRGRGMVSFEPVSPAAFVEPYLMRGIGKVVLLSATIRPAMLRDLGIGKADYAFIEAESPFPPSRRPIYWLKCGVRLRYDTGRLERQFHVKMIDQVLKGRLDRKGIIHAVSYARAQFIKEQSAFGDYMIVHDADTTRGTVEQFKSAAAPAILVSPSIHTGWDFPMDQAQWQIIAKVPFPDARGGIAGARQARDGSYAARFAATTAVQMAGRIVRSEDDAGETFIVDDTWDWFYHHNLSYFPKSFRDAVVTVTVPPAPLAISTGDAQNLRT